MGLATICALSCNGHLEALSSLKSGIASPKENSTLNIFWFAMVELKVPEN